MRRTPLHASSPGTLKGRVFYRTKTGMFGITKPIDGKAATHANGGTIGFARDSPEKVKAFHDAGVVSRLATSSRCSRA
jgi:hypothetical protein